jgi:fructokinase
MTREGVDLDLSLESDLPTAKAIISFNKNGVASYRFEIESTATFDFRQDWLPDENPFVIHIGSLATMVEPGSSALFQWLQALRGSTKPPTILFDPNVRPTFLNDVDRYRAAVENWISVADIVKASEDDLEFIYPKEDIEKVRQRWLMAGPSHLVITRGANGILGFTSNESVEVSGYEVDVIDTVGAGDTVGAIVMSTIAESGIDSLRGERFREVLDMAARVASITCSRQGANPPTRNDYEKAWGS